MKVGLIADIHGNVAALRAVMSRLADVDELLFLGDVSGYYPFVRESLALLPESGFTAVRGNHDDMLLRCLDRGVPPDAGYERRYGSALRRALQTLRPQDEALIRSWPIERRLVLDERAFYLAHGAPWEPLDGRVYPDFQDWARLDPIDAEVVALGNTHHAMLHRHAGRLIVNPGSVGQARDRSGTACCAILDTTDLEVEFVRLPYSTGSLIADARRHDPQVPYLVEVLTR